MKESFLQKEFKQSDVQRVRNIVNKDYNASTKTQSGYSKSNKKRKEGDVWEENGKMWTVKGGLKQNITKLDKAKKSIRIPLACPKCGTSMNYHLHKKMYKIHGFCFDCTIDYEAQLKKEGLYDSYVKNFISGNAKAWVKDLESWILETLEKDSSYVTEHGDVESWGAVGKDYKKEVKNELYNYIKLLREKIS